ncbi:hypothetical protein AX17_007274 [Amanita inopinata Kibby_2008]|nr:hypothetical protein AX17_007274 [Amanita inopinata Kibby_2008]
MNPVPIIEADLDILHYFPPFYWKLWLSESSVSQESKIHVYDVYDNILSEVKEIPTCSRSVLHDFTVHSNIIEPATQVSLDAAEEAFSTLEKEVEKALFDALSSLRANTKLRQLPMKQNAVENIRRYFSFLRFRNGAPYRTLIQSIREPVDNRTDTSAIYSAYHPLISQLHLRIILRTILSFLTSDDNLHLKPVAGHRHRSTSSLRRFHDAMDSYCWALLNAEVCIGIAGDDQEFVLPGTCYGTLNENYNESPDCSDLFFPIHPTFAVYLLGSDDVVACTQKENQSEIVYISVGIESAIDVHLRNAMIFNTYPQHLHLNSLRSASLTLACYDEFRWIQEHQDYSRLKQRCRQKFLQERVTKTLVIKDSITLVDLTDEVELIGNHPVAFGSFSDVWKGLWKDHIEGRERLVAVKYLRQAIFQDVRAKLMKRLQAECVAWHRLCHRHVNQLHGILQTSQSIGMVSQWCENGTIMEYIRENVRADKIKLLVQVASGMAHLHSCQPAVIHGDLKGGNILIDERGCAIISDFGLSKVMEGMGDGIGSSFFAGSTRWMAPELIRALVEDDGTGAPITTHSDVYAFGSVCLEVVTGRLPFPHRSNDHAVLVDILRGVRPCRGASRNISIPDENAFWAMLEKCWSESRKCRPSMQEMLAYLRSVMS